MGMKFVIEGIRKAGSTDTEAMIKALEGISVVSPLGEKVTIRPYDHQSDMGLLYGITAKDPKYPKHFVLKDIQYSPGGPFMTPIEEIKAIRAANIKK
jgi:branched-chain amino acid transport system substrate-binding protein